MFCLRTPAALATSSIEAIERDDQRRRKATEGVVQHLIALLDHVRCTAQVLTILFSHADGSRISFDRKCHSHHLRRRASHKCHAGMHRCDTGSSLTQRSQFVAGQRATGVEDDFPAPVLSSRKLQGRCGNCVIGHGDPDQIVVERLFAQRD